MSNGIRRVLVLWADGSAANYGVRVLAEGMADLARAAWGTDIEVDLQDFGVGNSEVSFGTRSILRDLGRKKGPIKEKLSRYDLILDSGAGDSFADIYGFRRLMFIFYAQHTAFRLGIPVVMGPQTIGPFNTAIGRWAARKSLRRMCTVVTRDTQSAKYARDLGRPADVESTDVVFALEPPPMGQGRDVILNISGLLWFPNGHIDAARYRAELAELVDALQEQGRQVSLLAHVVNSPRGNDDEDAIAEFQRDYGFSLESISPASLRQVRSVLAGASIVIGSRMHACLNALSAGTPAIPWAYSRKFAPLMRDIGWDHIVDLADLATRPARATLELLASTNSAQFDEEVLAVQQRARERLSATVLALRQVDSARLGPPAADHFWKDLR
ncbi:polysaccharide pyruvyl transferase family protein [Mycolicibacterium austroafricanum]|uniref:polysaccharide pyruvyl transferase family protein n=1 Tax=Mycolicibacterium austroafricanum TaxID=39687 RepID=UPI001CA3825F|nr:polysaccharide pyruvyl transferase family protein [Mycolicibacterium austroafricanum]QZT58435.1 polysaccharide pyruvyl transferase family protein [Mycolicibacterium austroafricanum]